MRLRRLLMATEPARLPWLMWLAGLL